MIADSSGVPEKAKKGLGSKHMCWRTFCTSGMVLAWVMAGVKLFWVNDIPPPPREFDNSRVAMSEVSYVSEAVGNLCSVGAAEECERSELEVISPLSVAYRLLGTGQPPKKRLIFNGRYLNQFLEVRKFKYESLEMVRDLLVPEGNMWSFDLTSGYYHIEIHRDFWKYMGFQWEGKYYRFRVLPFGLAIAPYIFTRVTRELARKWRGVGVRLIAYIDDFIFLGAPGVEALAAFIAEQAGIIADVLACGFLINWEKTIGRFAPVKVIHFLGFGIDSMSQVFFSPEARWNMFIALVRVTLRTGRASARTISRIAGKAISFSLAIGAVARLFSREMYRVVESRVSWDIVVTLDEFVVSELAFWAGLEREWFVSPIWPVVMALHSNLAWSDAGAIGWGSHVKLRSGVEHEARGFLTLVERLYSSTRRELMVFFRFSSP